MSCYIKIILEALNDNREGEHILNENLDILSHNNVMKKYEGNRNSSTKIESLNRTYDTVNRNITKVKGASVFIIEELSKRDSMEFKDLDKVKDLELLGKWSKDYHEIKINRREFLKDAFIQGDIKINDYIENKKNRFFLRKDSSTV
jgi:hypothetical protein